MTPQMRQTVTTPYRELMTKSPKAPAPMTPHKSAPGRAADGRIMPAPGPNEVCPACGGTGRRELAGVGAGIADQLRAAGIGRGFGR